jgi:DtxR family Mn-dependent transcriptional regulator
MDERELSEQAEEILAALWVAGENGVHGPAPLASLPSRSDDALRQLSQAGLIELGGDAASLTTQGQPQAASVVRRERLAERLLADVLNLRDDLATEAACKFEHVLREGVDDRICTLLGHPRVCPHGSPIPPGPCCREGAVAAAKVISSLADLTPGQTGVIAYLHSQRQDLVQRLLAMGAVPGARLLLRQKTPSFVFTIGHGEIAVDKETAQDIYVRLSPPSAPHPRRHWFGHRTRRRAGRG